MASLRVKTEIERFQFLGKAAKIGHGPATVIGCFTAESQETYPTGRS